MSHIAGEEFEVHMAVNVIYLMLWSEQYFYFLFYKMLFRRHQVHLTYSSCPIHFQHLKSLENFPHPYFAVFQICILALTLIS